MVVKWWQEYFLRWIAAQQVMCGSVRYPDAETTVPATSSEPHRATSAILEMSSNSLSKRYELMVHQTVDVKGYNEHQFIFGSDEVWYFFLVGEDDAVCHSDECIFVFGS
jgi:hypothetical protein